MEDCISRQAAIDEVKALRPFALVLDGGFELYADYDVEYVISHLPSVQERKKGKWIRYEEQKPLKYGYELIIKGKCSNCGEVFDKTYKMKCCPNCFAEMESE